jgi:hypothetical protein
MRGWLLVSVVLGSTCLAQTAPKTFAGFDRNLYPGDATMKTLRAHFAFTGYWLTPPPGARSNTWPGKRKLLRDLGYGFLVLANGRLDRQIKSASVAPDQLGQQDAVLAIAAAAKEGFPAGTIIFLDQEEGGRLLPEQTAYFFGWTEAVARSRFKPGAYVSGIPSPDGTGEDPDSNPRTTITTAQDVTGQIAAKHLRPVALWVVQDGCPPAPGCTVQPPKSVAESGTLDAMVWQYARSPRVPVPTRACSRTYAADNNCYAGGASPVLIDLDAARSADPSHGR